MAKKNTNPQKSTPPPPDPTPESEPTPPPAPAAPAGEDVAVNGKMSDKSKKKPAVSAPAAAKNVPTEPTGKAVVVKSSDTSLQKKRLPIWVWVAIGVAVLGGLTGLGIAMFGSADGDTDTVTNTILNTNSTAGFVPRVIDGVLVPENKARTNTYAIMIENIVESRPPSGLDKASVVYEALAEGGITRFMALFPVGDEIPEIGPVRSARKYYIPYAEEYKALYIHAGGSPDALTYLGASSTNVVDFNQFRNGGNFWRDKTRRAPHNLFTSTELLLRGLRHVAPDLQPTFSSWLYQTEPSITSLPEVTKDIVINYPSFNYRATFKYDRSQNIYARYHGDTEHVTKDGGKIRAKNVIVLFVKTGLLNDDKQRLEMETIGEGKLLLFRDGLAQIGTWKKTSASARTEFLDDSGEPFALNPGVTWISVVPTDRTVEY